MLIIRIKRTHLKIAIAIVLTVSVGSGIILYLQNIKLMNNHRTAFYIENQYRTSSLPTFIASMNTSEYGDKGIEIFDINKGEVIKRVEASNLIQKIASEYIKKISGMYVKVKAFPDKGHIVRIPLDPSIKAESHWLNDYNINFVEEIFVLFPEVGDPYLLVLDERARPYFYTFEGDADEMLKLLDFK